MARSLVHHQEEGVSDVDFTGPDGEPLPDESSVGDAAWHGGFDMTVGGKLVRLYSVYLVGCRRSQLVRICARHKGVILNEGNVFRVSILRQCNSDRFDSIR